MSAIGVKNLIAATVTAHTDGSAITYGTGVLISPLVQVNVALSSSDNPDYGNDIKLDDDLGLNGYNATLETNELNPAGRVLLLGYTAAGSGTSTYYQVGTGNPPEVGWGYISAKRFKGVDKFEARWFHKARFQEQNITATTKRDQIEWQHYTLNATGIGAYIDNSGNAKYFDYMEFSALADAETWLYAKANYTP